MQIQRTSFLPCAGLIAALAMLVAPWLIRQTPLQIVDCPRSEMPEVHGPQAGENIPRRPSSWISAPQEQVGLAQHISPGDIVVTTGQDCILAEEVLQQIDAVITAAAVQPAPAESGATGHETAIDAHIEPSSAPSEWNEWENTRWIEDRLNPWALPAAHDATVRQSASPPPASKPSDVVHGDLPKNFAEQLGEADVHIAPASPQWSGDKVKQEPLYSSDPSRAYKGLAPSAPSDKVATTGQALATEQDMQLGALMAEWTGGEIVAWVDDEPIVSAEVLPRANEAIKKYKEKYKDSVSRESADAARALVNGYLKPLIETKLLFAEAKRNVPKENMPRIRTEVDELFERDNVPTMIADVKVESRDELDQKLRAEGSSLDMQRRAFFERTVASQWIHHRCKKPHRFSRLQMLDYYNAHIAEYETPARARWEQLRVRIDMHESREEARQLLAGWERELRDGASLAEMAKTRSEVQLSDEGRHDWTRKGSLVSAELDAAIFTLPIGELSQIIDDERGLSIVRVVEREEASRKSFAEVEDGIKEILTDTRFFAQADCYMQQLRDRAKIRTIFDDPAMLPVATRPTDALK